MSKVESYINMMVAKQGTLLHLKSERMKLLLLISLLGLSQVKAYCQYDTIIGTWIFSESERTYDNTVSCSSVGTVFYTKEFTLSFPNTVTDELGNTGTFTTVGTMGFEVNINGRSYWAGLAYGYYLWDCDNVFPGVAHDKTVRNWSCFSATKKTATTTKKVSRQVPTNLPDRQFKNDQDMINNINSMQSAWTAKAYPENEKYTVKQMLLRAGGTEHFSPLPMRTAPASEELKARVSTLPASFDWRDVNGVNYISPVRDQAQCGSCYAFASMGALEARLRIATRNERTDIFSTQDIVECSPYSYGCGGGYSYLVSGRFTKEQGVISESCNPYLGVDGTCNRVEGCSSLTYVSDYQYVGGYYGACNEELMKETLINEGPLTVNYMVYDDFYYYSGGVYYHTETKSEFNPYVPTNHAVLIVGYGTDTASGLPYWDVKNSWGDTFGESGFFRILRGTNECGIESAAFSPTILP